LPHQAEEAGFHGCPAAEVPRQNKKYAKR